LATKANSAATSTKATPSNVAAITKLWFATTARGVGPKAEIDRVFTRSLHANIVFGDDLAPALAF
jgi:hypothetical protein